MAWQNWYQLGSRQFTCGWCGFVVAAQYGFHTHDGYNQIYVCPHCDRPSIFWGGTQVPGVAFGAVVNHLPGDIDALYREARNCAAAACYTAAVLICRKLLMNVAVAQGAKEGQTFIAYVEHLASSGFVPPNGRAWVDHIRQKGNEATHEIQLMSAAEAEDLISFAEMLLKFIYEFPQRVPTRP